jgi:coenzyme F420 hydrogenase subunit beta
MNKAKSPKKGKAPVKKEQVKAAVEAPKQAVARACQELEASVLKSDLCTYCGACAGMCPYLVPYKGRMVVRDACSLEQGRCRAFCPRFSLDLDEVHRALFGTGYHYAGLGSIKQICIARATDPAIRKKAQYGGTVTALLSLALKEGLIDAAVTTRTGAEGLPEGIVAITGQEVESCAGSNYAAAPTVAAFNEACRTGDRKKIGIVAMPCQAMALAKMQADQSGVQNNSDRIAVTIGLFCTWALSPDAFCAFIEEKTGGSRITRVDITAPPVGIFELYTASGRIPVPLDEVRKFIRPGCTYCIDMTAEFADIAVGSAEGIEGWNTVIARTDRGVELLKKAIRKKALEVDALPDQNLKHLKEASDLKKKRGLKNIVQKTGREDDLLYIKGDVKRAKRFSRG